MDAKKTGELIAKLRREKGWSQTELAERVGVTNKAVSRWETGRGYPDVELLPKLAKELDITISELLEGETAPPEEMPPAVEGRMEQLCENAGREKRRRNRLIAALAAVLAVYTVLVGGLWLYPRLVGFAEAIIGSPVCVIDADYGGLTYYGQRYVPLPMDGIEGRSLGRVLEQEPQVEGVGFWGKLFFGETLYALGDDYTQDIVYLDSDYDELISPYFVREPEYDFYAEKLASAQFDVCCGVIWREDDSCAVFRLDDRAEQYLREAELGEQVELGSWGDADWRIDVRMYESERLFYRTYGEIIAAGGEYYWSPYEYSEVTGTFICSRYFRVEGDLFASN